MGKKDIDYILEKIVGGGHRWQWRTALLLVPIYISTGIPTLLHVFSAYTPKHRCFVKGCDRTNGRYVNRNMVTLSEPTSA